MNGATEATLQDLLAVAQAMNANLVGLNRLINRMSTGTPAAGAGGAAGGGLGGLAAAAGPASVALGALRVAGSAVSSVFGVMGDIIGKTITGLTATVSNLYEFAKSAANGTAKLSDFYAAFKDLPFFIGSVMSLFADIIRYQEGMMDSYLAMTRAGATFSGSLTVMRDVATRGYMSLDEMTKIVRANSEVFATLGGNVDSGLRKFIDVQNKLMGPGSQYSRQLLGLGFTSETVAELLASVYQQQANLNKQDLQNSNRVAEAVANTAKELDLFSRATGKNREELEKELKQKSFDAAWKTFTQGLSAEEAKRAEAAIAKAFSIGGQGAADGVKQMFMTGGLAAVPITDAMKQFAVQTGGAADEFYQTFYQSAMNTKLTDQERLELQLRATRDLGRSYNEFIGPLGQVGGILSLQGNNFVNNAALMNTALKFGALTNSQISRMAQEAAKNQKAASDGSAGALQQAQLNIRQFGQTIMNLVNQIVGPIAGYLIQFGGVITEQLTPTFNRIVSWFKGTIDDLRAAYGESGFKGLFKKLGEKIVEAAGNVRDFISPLWESMRPAMIALYNDYVKPFLSTVFTGIMDFIISNLRKNSAIARFLFSETDTERAERERIEADPLYRQLLEAERNRVAEANRAAGSEFAVNVVDYDAVMAEYRAELARQRTNEANRAATARLSPRDIRHSGTLGMTGSWWEKEDKVVQVQAGETVATQGQIAQIVDAASQKGVAESILALNNTMRTLIAVSQRIEENTKETVRATKHLNGDVFKMV